MPDQTANPVRRFLARCLYEARWRAFPYLRRLYAVEPGTSISTRAIVRDPRLVKLGRGVKIGHGAELWTFAAHPRGGPYSILCADDADIRPYALLHAYGGYIEVGRYSAVNSFCFINGGGGVEIGDDVMMGTNTAILSSEHGIAPGETPMARQTCVDRPVVIEDNVYIGSGVTILAGVRIGTGAVVAAGAVVRRDVPPNAIVAGVPAEVIRYRDAEAERAAPRRDG